MGNRVGLILHEDWNEFSPLLYSHHGADSLPWELQNYLRQYILDNDINDNCDGHKFNCCHMIVGFIQSTSKNIHVRVENLSNLEIQKLIDEHECSNCFDGGCWIVNVSTKNYGAVSGDGDNGYILKNNNIVFDEFYKPEEESCFI